MGAACPGRTRGLDAKRRGGQIEPQGTQHSRIDVRDRALCLARPSDRIPVFRAGASHRIAENAAASQNLESLWKQMTPPERQAAIKQ